MVPLVFALGGIGSQGSVSVQDRQELTLFRKDRSGHVESGRADWMLEGTCCKRPAGESDSVARVAAVWMVGGGQILDIL